MSKYTKEFLEASCQQAACAARLAEILKVQRISKSIYKLIKDFSIDISHWVTPMRKGQSKYYSLINTKINHFLILEVIPQKDKNSTRTRFNLKCKCDCGNIETYRSCYFSRITRCVNCDPNPRIHKDIRVYYDLPIKYLNTIKTRAKLRNLEFNLTKEYIWKLFLKQNRKCAISNINIELNINRKFQTASLDRIDSSKGYIEGNVQWVNKVINMMKQTMNTEDFIYMCNLVTKNEIIDNNKILRISQEFTHHMKHKKWR